MYDEDEPEVWSDTKLSRPPLPRPEGTWNRIPVIFGIQYWLCGKKSRDEDTYHHNERIPIKEPAIQIRDEPDRKCTGKLYYHTFFRERENFNNTPRLR